MLHLSKGKKYNKKKKDFKNHLIELAILLIIIFTSILFLNIDNDLIVLELEDNNKYLVNKVKINLEELEKQVNIQEVEYKFEGRLNESNKPNKIIIHHAAGSDITAQDINRIHIEEGYKGIGYHFYIRKDGAVYRGRPETVEGAHTIGQNNTSIGICLEGNIDNEMVSEKQLSSLELLSEYLAVKYNIETIDGHNDYNSTRCPGKNISIEGLNESVKNKLVDLANK